MLRMDNQELALYPTFHCGRAGGISVEFIANKISNKL